MPELDFAGLREQLERDVRQPEFALIRARRARRTAWWAATGSVVALVVVLAVAVPATAYLRHSAAPVAPIGTPTVQPSPPPPTVSTPTPAPSDTAPVPEPANVVAMTAAPSGTLFALLQRCVSNCLAQPTYVDVLLRGSNLGIAWTTVGNLPAGLAPGGLLAASDSALWLVGHGQVAGSSDGGHTWQSWSFGSNSSIGGGGTFDGLAGGTAWIAGNGVVAVATGGGRPANTPAQPPGADLIDGLAVLGPDRAAVLIGTSNGAPGTWFLTTDRGAHWTSQADPCANTPYPGSMWNTMAGAPDGSLWVVCAGGGGAGQQRKQLVTSVDGGYTWILRGDLESTGYATTVFPFSATVAWRTGGRADLYRTTDASHWTTVAITGDAAGGGTSFFTALGPSSGVYVQMGAVYSTVDGGHTWQKHPLPSIVSACRTSDLTLSIGGSGVAAGTWSALLVFTNRSNVTCEMTGYPTLVGVMNASDTTRATEVDQVMNGLNVPGSPAVTVAPGAKAGVIVSGTDGAGCPPAYQELRVTPPGGGEPLAVSAHLEALSENMPSCGGLRVSAVHPLGDFSLSAGTT